MSSTHFDQQLFGRLTHYQIFNTLSDSEFHVLLSKTIWPTDIWPIARTLKHHLAVSLTHFDQQLFGYLTHYKIFNTLSDSEFRVFLVKNYLADRHLANCQILKTLSCNELHTFWSKTIGPKDKLPSKQGTKGYGAFLKFKQNNLA